MATIRPIWPWPGLRKWRTTDGRWEVRIRKVDRYRTMWVIWDRRHRRQTGPIGFATPDGAKEYCERYFLNS